MASSGRRRVITVVLVLVSVLVAAAVVIATYAKTWLKARIVDAAAKEGVRVAVADVDLGVSALFGGPVALHDVRAEPIGVPEIRLHVEEAVATRDGLALKALTATGGELTILGEPEEIARKLTEWSARRPRPSDGAGGGSAAPAAQASALHVIWRGVLGPATLGDATGVDVHVENELARVRTSALTVAGIASGLGPWKVDADLASDAATVSVWLEPNRPSDRANVLLSTRAEPARSSIVVEIPRAPAQSLGIPPALLGLPAAGTSEIEAKLTAEIEGDADLRGIGTLAVYRLPIPGAPRPLDVKLSGEVSGDPKKPLALQKGRLVLGPVRAAVSGPIEVVYSPKRELLGARGSFAYRTEPTPCAKVAEAALDTALDATGMMGGMARGLGNLAQTLGENAGLPPPPKLPGQLVVTGTITFDSRDLRATGATLKPVSVCGLPLFGAP